VIVLLSEFNFAHVEPTDSADLVVSMYFSGSFTLSLGKCEVNEVLPCGNSLYLLEIVENHFLTN
jgi:hypothetical protein